MRYNVAMQSTNATAAYRAGWNAAQRTADLDAAEARFVRRYGPTFHRHFVDGWHDRAIGATYKKEN